MSNALTESPAPPYKDRRGWLIAFGIVEILLGAFSVLVGGFMLVALVFLKSQHTFEMPVGVHIAAVVFSVGTYVVIAALFFVAGIGSIRRRNWARILMLIVGTLWLAVGVLATLFLIFLLPKILATQQAVPQEAAHIESIVMGVIALLSIVFGILLPLAFLIFYSRKSVKATCLARQEATSLPAEGGAAQSPSRRLPVPVIVVVGWEALGAVSSLLIFILPMRVTTLFGFIVHGGWMVAVALVFSALSAAAAWLIYRMRLAGWTIAFLKLLFFGSSAAVSLASGSMSQLALQMGQPLQQPWLPQILQFNMGAALIVCAAYLALLIYCRKFFVSAAHPVTS